MIFIRTSPVYWGGFLKTYKQYKIRSFYTALYVRFHFNTTNKDGILAINGKQHFIRRNMGSKRYVVQVNLPSGDSTLDLHWLPKETLTQRPKDIYFEAEIYPEKGKFIPADASRIRSAMISEEEAADLLARTMGEENAYFKRRQAAHILNQPRWSLSRRSRMKYERNLTRRMQPQEYMKYYQKVKPKGKYRILGGTIAGRPRASYSRMPTSVPIRAPLKRVPWRTRLRRPPLKRRRLAISSRRKPDYYAGITDAQAIEALQDYETAKTLAELSS